MPERYCFIENCRSGPNFHNFIMSIIHQCEGAHSPKVERFSYDYYTDKFAEEAKKQFYIVHVYTFAMESAEEMSAITYIAATMSGRSAATMSGKFATMRQEAHDHLHRHLNHLQDVPLHRDVRVRQDFRGQDPARPRDAGEQRNMKADHAEFLGLGQRLTSGLKGKSTTTN